MAYNAGENRVLQAVRKGGTGAHPSQLPGLSRATYTYVQKLHALACSLEQAGEHPDWLASLDRPVPRLQPLQLPSDFGDLSSWAQGQGHDAEQLAELNPALSPLRRAPAGGPLWVLAPAAEGASQPMTASSLIAPEADPAPSPAAGDHRDEGTQARRTSYTVHAAIRSGPSPDATARASRSCSAGTNWTQASRLPPARCCSWSNRHAETSANTAWRAAAGHALHRPRPRHAGRLLRIIRPVADQIRSSCTSTLNCWRMRLT